MSVLKTAALGLLLGAAPLSSALAADSGSPGLDALAEFRSGTAAPPAIQNRFFLKAERFELTPTVGLVTSNPLAKRYVGGLTFAYHFNEHLADPEMTDVSALESAGRGHCRAILATNKFLFY